MKAEAASHDESVRAARTRTLLREAEDHLTEGRAALSATPPHVREALPHVLAAARATLQAVVAWNGSTTLAGADGAEADLAALTVRASHFANALRTPAHRLLQLAGRAPAIARSATPTVYEREEVEVGWYAARNLYQAATGELSWLFQETPLRYTSA